MRPEDLAAPKDGKAASAKWPKRQRQGNVGQGRMRERGRQQRESAPESRGGQGLVGGREEEENEKGHQTQRDVWGGGSTALRQQEDGIITVMRLPLLPFCPQCPG